MHGSPIRHCRQCGTAVEHRIPDDGDTKLRAVCPSCHTIHYVNPLNVVGTIPVWGDKVLLCKRNIEPRKGKWTLPAGFMELGETTAEGAARETTEEAGAQFAMEGVIDRLAEKVGIDGWTMRQLNVIMPGQVWGPGQIMDDGCLGASECLKAIKPAYDAGARIHSNSWGCAASTLDTPYDCNVYVNVLLPQGKM
jgi:hypothetical protein